MKDYLIPNLRILKKIYALTQEDMGGIIGKNQTEISKLFRGNYGSIFEEHLEMLAKHFNTNVKTLRSVDLSELVLSHLAEYDSTFEDGAGI